MGDVYGLHHGLLNIQVPPKTMWMNLGYWTEECYQDSSTAAQVFEKACQALFDALLMYSGYLEKVGHSNLSKKDQALLVRHGQPLRIIDLGFGCGDQTLRLASHWNYETEFDLRASGVNYVGITNNASQCSLASERIQQVKLPMDFQVALTCADAAKPDLWPKSLSDTTQKMADEFVNEQVLIVALDCLYHFRPSRESIFSYSYSDAQASIVLFDLILTHGTTFLERLLLWFICLLLRVPYSNFVTLEVYVAQLVRAGYRPDRITIKEISDKVFIPLANNLDTRHRDLKKYGVGGLGVYRIAARIFRWFGTRKVVHGCVIRAHR